MPVDFFASDVHFGDHLAPIWHALPAAERGVFLVTFRRLAAHMAGLGITATHDLPADPGRPTLVASFGDQKHVQALGRHHLARLEHGIGQSFIDSRNGSYAGGVGASLVELFLCPNDHSAARWRASYPQAQVAVVGCPKLDSLPQREGGPGVPPVVALSFHWPGGDRRTGELAETSGAFYEYRDTLGALRDRYPGLLGHGHPRFQSLLQRYYRRLEIPFVAAFADVCRQADLYVCDTNSTLYEFASTSRPVVVVNAKVYRRGMHHGLRFWEAATVGVQCDAPAALPAAIDAALIDPPAQQAAREAALDLVYAYRHGAAQRAAAALLAWCGAGVGAGA